MQHAFIYLQKCLPKYKNGECTLYNVWYVCLLSIYNVLLFMLKCSLMFSVMFVLLLSARIDLDIIYLNVYAHLILDIH